MSEVGRRRAALFVLFFLPGVALASWVTRTPAIRDLLHASPAEMGLVLFGLSVGSMCGILSSGALVARFGARPVIFAGMVCTVVAMPGIGVGTALESSWLVAAGLFVFGLGMGGGEVAMNVEGADVEQVLSRPVLPALHGCFSLGNLAGALAGILFTALDVPVVWHLVMVGVLAAVGLVVVIGWVPPGTGRAVPMPRAGRGSTAGRPLWKDRTLLLIGAIVLAMALAEGSASDWLPLVMVDGHGLDPAYGSAVYAAFAAAMTAGRFAGGVVIERLGRARVIAMSAGAASIGLVLIIFVDQPIVAAAGVLLWGLGASLGFPVALSAAGDSGPNSARRVSLVATVGYVAFLVGPPSLGFIGEHYGLRLALLVPLVLVALVIPIAPALGRAPAAETADPDADSTRAEDGAERSGR